MNAALGDKRAWPVGTPVYVLRADNTLVKTTTRTVPLQLDGQTWVVWLNGIVGYLALDRVNYRGGAEGERECAG